MLPTAGGDTHRSSVRAKTDRSHVIHTLACVRNVCQCVRADVSILYEQLMRAIKRGYVCLSCTYAIKINLNYAKCWSMTWAYLRCAEDRLRLSSAHFYIAFTRMWTLCLVPVWKSVMHWFVQFFCNGYLHYRHYEMVWYRRVSDWRKISTYNSNIGKGVRSLLRMQHIKNTLSDKKM